MNEGTVIAVGEAGTILSSSDASNWTLGVSGTTQFLSGAAFGGALFVAVGGGGTVISSPDGINWTARNSGATAFLQNVAWGDNQFVAVGAGGTILHSPDGVNWTLATSPVLETLTSVTWFNGQFIAVGQDGVILISPDGTSWSTTPSGTPQWLRSVVSGPAKAVAVGESGTIISTPDGLAWSAETSPVTGLLSGVGFGLDRYVAVGELRPTPPIESLIVLSPLDEGFRFSAGELTVGEANGVVMVAIERTAPAAGAASVDYATVAGTADAGADYQPVSGTAQFADGQTVVQIPVTLLNNNTEAEGLEIFSIGLSSALPADREIYEPSSIAVSIVDAQDADGDGLPDDWEIQHFGDFTLYGPADDPDGDQNDNGRELSDGTIPSDGNSANYILSSGVTAGQGGLMVSPDQPVYSPGDTVTITPLPAPHWRFVAWGGDASGTTDPLVITMSSDASIEASFELPLEVALDGGCPPWVVGGSGPPWVGQTDITYDGGDAATVSGLQAGESSSIEIVVDGPAEVSFRWKSAINFFDSLGLYFDGQLRFSISGTRDWEQRSVVVGAGSHTLRWTSTRAVSFGNNQVWLDAVSADFGYDQWKATFFNPTEQANVLVSGAEADPDGDGMSNLQEFALGTHPRLADRHSASVPTIQIDDSGAPAIVWAQHSKRRDLVAVSVEVSSTMADGSWVPISSPIEELSSTENAVSLRVVDGDADTQPRRFYRVSFSDDP